MRDVEGTPSFEMNAELKETKLRTKRWYVAYALWITIFFITENIERSRRGSKRGPERAPEGGPERGPEGGPGFVYTQNCLLLIQIDRIAIFHLQNLYEKKIVFSQVL